MSDKLFFHDYINGRDYSYANLLEDVNNSDKVPVYCYSKDPYNTFLTIISAIVSKINLVLLDSDFSDAELQNLGINPTDLSKLASIDKHSFYSKEDLLQALMENQDWQLTLFTSGTTGIPKQVVHSLSSLTRAVRKSERHQDDVWGFAYNPTHIAGLQVFFQAFLNGNSIIDLFEADRETVLSILQDYLITNISATPTFYRLLLPLNEKFPSVKRLTSGGEKFDENLSSSLTKPFPNARLRNVYASTEAGTILETRDEIFSITDDSQCRIIEGELHIHQSLLGEGEELSLKDGEWYATGDLVEIISENPLRFRFISRKNEMVNVGGYKVNPYETEQALETHPVIRQAYVYGKTSSLIGNMLMADVVVTEPITEKDLRIFLTPLLQPYKIPRVINFVEHIELTRTGKLKRT